VTDIKAFSAFLARSTDKTHSSNLQRTHSGRSSMERV